MNIIRKNIPNTITCLNLAGGVASIIFSGRGTETSGLLAGYQWGMVFILFSALCDFLDGLAARMLKAYSSLGKELDSLSDLVSFGVAPAVMIFSCAHSMGIPVWVCWLSLLIPVCGALRLARFNLDTSGSRNFRGLPIPSAALFSIGLSEYIMQGGMAWWLIAAGIVFPALTMVSSLRMYSLKITSMRVGDAWPQYLLLAVGAVCLAFFCISGLVWVIIFYVATSFLLSKSRFTD